MRPFTVLFMAIFLTTGCFHATVETDATPSNVVLGQPWANSFLWGLVPPPTVESARKCPTSVAKVETQLTFLNLVATMATAGIYSPMAVTVTCAQSQKGDARTLRARPDNLRRTLVRAANISRVRKGEAVYVVFAEQGSALTAAEHLSTAQPHR